MREKNSFVIYIVFCVIFLQVTSVNSRTSSTLWKLEEGKITSGSPDAQDAFAKVSVSSGRGGVIVSDELVFNIIATTAYERGTGGAWSKQPVEKSCDSGFDRDKSKNLTGGKAAQNHSDAKNLKKVNRETSENLDCGKPVNFTYYDYLIGVGQRFNHPLVPEPEVAFLFLKNKDERSLKNFDVINLEKRLRRAKREKPRSVHLYNQIGNYWRIKGDARQSIECFRKALAISPTNAEVLLNLARVLFNLQYLDDAIHLTRRSLEVQPPDRSAWRQYFTLGEIFKAYGHFQESLLHLRHALELYPQHEPILKALRDVENTPASSLHFYTILIIFALVLAVFIVIITSTDNSDSNNSQNEFEPKIQRHFNRAMAMRSLKGFSPRTFKHRKY